MKSLIAALNNLARALNNHAEAIEGHTNALNKAEGTLQWVTEVGVDLHLSDVKLDNEVLDALRLNR